MAMIIDPFARTVSAWAPKDTFLQSLRNSIDATQLDNVLVQKGVCLWVDNFGLLRVPQAFFRFEGSLFRFAGKAVLTGIDPDGMPCELRGSTPEEIAAQLDWCDGLAVVRIVEELQVDDTDLGKWPRVVRKTEFNQPVPSKIDRTAAFDTSPVPAPIQAPDSPPRAANGNATVVQREAQPEPQGAVPPPMGVEGPPLSRWAVTSNDDTDTYQAVETDASTGRETGRVETFKDMGAVTAFFRAKDAMRIAVPSDAPDDLVGIFVAPITQ